MTGKENSVIEKKEAKNLKIYFLLSFIIFWLLLALTGLIISMEAPLLIQNIMKNVCSWTPTFVIIIMFRRLYPGISAKEYLRRNFKKQTKPIIFIVSFLLQILLAALAVAAVFLINTDSLKNINFIAGSAVLPVLIMDLTSGALGEELGWRGYALNILQKKYAPLSAGLLLGLVWGLWHLPLMILSGYAGVELVLYMAAFMLGIISFSVVITFFYNKSKNIFIAMWMHFWFNFLLKIVIVDLLVLLICVSIGYLIFAVLVSVFNRNEMFSKKGVN